MEKYKDPYAKLDEKPRSFRVSYIAPEKEITQMRGVMMVEKQETFSVQSPVGNPQIWPIFKVKAPYEKKELADYGRSEAEAFDRAYGLARKRAEEFGVKIVDETSRAKSGLETISDKQNSD